MTNSFIQSGIYTQGCFVPVTCEDPSLVIKETKDDSKKWGIAIFIGSECIGLINHDTDMSSLHRSILSCPVSKDNVYVGSVAQRIKSL